VKPVLYGYGTDRLAAFVKLQEQEADMRSQQALDEAPSALNLDISI
jgi:hypothetical protein